MKGRALREEGKLVLEMELREANRLAGALVEATAVQLASDLVERDVVDGAEWTGEFGRGACRWRSRATVGCPRRFWPSRRTGVANPTGHTTAGWAAALDRLHVERASSSANPLRSN